MGKIIRKNKGNNNLNEMQIKLKSTLRESQDEISVDLVNLGVGGVYFKCPLTKEVFMWNEGGDVRNVPLRIIFSIQSNAKSLLEDLHLGIIEAYGIGFELEDLICAIGLKESYEPFNFDVGSIDDIIIDSNQDDFRKLCEKCSKKILERIAKRYLFLREENLINERSKELDLEHFLDERNIFIETI
ncbi:hypothetical protein [Peptostreptococcus faecalis]|uniref:hypothetical protein n=1 Tax=Peptostreptococcus faecalis TaxID=2045015 RepID=UPI000C7E1F01|nr:hypothetical protein [Peptostreptococcus faecalis]